MTENERERESAEGDRLAGIGEAPTEETAAIAAAMEAAIEAAERAGEEDLAKALSDLDLVHGFGVLAYACRSLHAQADTVRAELERRRGGRAW